MDFYSHPSSLFGSATSPVNWFKTRDRRHYLCVGDTLSAHWVAHAVVDDYGTLIEVAL